MTLTQNILILSYNDTEFQKKYNKLDINKSEYLYKFVDIILKKSLSAFKKNNKKPFTLSHNRNTIIIQYPNSYDISDYDNWYQLVQNTVNKYFYKKESENDDIPDLYQRKRLFTTINSKEYELDGNIVVKSIPVYRPKRTQKKTNVSKENKDMIKNLNGTKELNKHNSTVMFFADDSDDDSDWEE